MSMLIFNYILAAFLFAFAYYVDSRADRQSGTFTGITMTSAFTVLLAGISAHLLQYEYQTVSLLSLRLALVFVAITSVTLFRYSFSSPYGGNNVVIRVLSNLFMLFSLVVAFKGITSISLDEMGRYAIGTGPFFGIMPGLRLFTLLYIIGFPALTVFLLFVRAVGLHSRIFRQRLIFVAVSICAGFAVSWALYRFSLVYAWALPLAPFGLAVMLVLIFQSQSVTTLYDRTLATAIAINFVVMSLVFSALTGFGSAALVGAVASPVASVAGLVVIAVAMLFIREIVSKRLRKYVRVGSDYESELEAGLDAIDYTSGGELVINNTVSLLERYVECASVDIMVSDDKGKLVTAYSSIGAKNELVVAENKAIDFLLSHTESIVLKTQAITNHMYADVKPNLLKIFDIGHSDAFILLREGHRVVGIILLGPKKRGADYTEYDYRVLSKLYSNFFLVMYYLKNIANESVVLTVDREIEFSGQIITSIQDNIDRINHEKVDVDFITKSARKLGGDFIDFIKLAEDKYLFVMGDVSGKGLNASMSMVILKSVLRTFLSETKDFKQLVIKVNLFIKNNLPKGTFFAGVFGLMDFSTNVLYYLNCGVPAMFLFTASYNNAIEIQGDGKVLGFVKDIGKYLKVKKIALNPQDILLMTTDGLIDATNLRGERFGKDRVQRHLMDNRSYPSGRIAKFLSDNLAEFVSRELEDDITILVMKYLSK
jgi:serine phosphatase RsbU (regulator of sigma subunit)